VRGLLILLAWAGLLTAGVMASMAFTRRQWRRLGEARRVLAEACGVTGIEVTPRGALTGRHGALALRLASYVYRRRRGTEVMIQGIAPDVTLAPVGAFDRVAHVLGSTDPRTGDPAFDARVALHGPVATARALLDAPTRAGIRELFARFAAGRIDRGSFSFQSTEARRGPDSLDAVTLHQALQLAHALERPAAPEARLAAIVREDPIGTVRALALQALCERGVGRPDAQEGLQHASVDPDPSVRLYAGRALGPRGETVLLALATDGAVPDAVSAEAIDALGEAFPLEHARAVLLREIASGRVDTARSALRRCLAGGAAEVPVLSAALAAEPAVAAEAARALGRVAGADAVEALHGAEARGGDVRRAAREAIATIQSRLVGASPGQVALAEGDSGRLSVVDGADGRVSLETGE
jgi:hypothetical protein